MASSFLGAEADAPGAGAQSAGCVRTLEGLTGRARPWQPGDGGAGQEWRRQLRGGCSPRWGWWSRCPSGEDAAAGGHGDAWGRVNSHLEPARAVCQAQARRGTSLPCTAGLLPHSTDQATEARSDRAPSVPKVIELGNWNSSSLDSPVQVLNN